MTCICSGGIVATIATASCIAVPTTASASAGNLPPTYRSDGAQSGAAAASAFSPAAFHAGDTPADYPGASRVPSAAPTAFRAADTPADYPGASRAPSAAPTAFHAGDAPANDPGASRARTAARPRSSRPSRAHDCAGRR